MSYADLTFSNLATIDTPQIPILRVGPEDTEPPRRAVEALNDGQVIIYPTDTLYALSCRIDRAQAVRRVFAIKRRPTSEPLPVLLADPSDERGLKTLARWVDREARMADSDKIRCYATHAAIRRVLRRSGYFVVKSAVEITVKINAVAVPKAFYSSADEWHFTLGDGDLDH